MPDAETPSEAPPADWPADVAKVVGRRVAMYRTRRKMTAQDVSNALAKVGVTLKRPVISNLENGYRGTVSIAEVIALGHVLNVPPIALIFPLGEDPDYTLLPGMPSSTEYAEMWFTGATNYPIPEPPADRDLWVAEHDRLSDLHKHRDLIVDLGRLKRIIASKDPGSQDPRVVDYAGERIPLVEREIQQLRRRLQKDGMRPPRLFPDMRYLDDESAVTP